MSREESPLRKQVVHTPDVPPARVPLSQAIKVGDWVFASGQLGLDVATGKLAPGGIVPETRRVCENLKAVLEAADRPSTRSSRSRSTWSISPSWCR